MIDADPAFEALLEFLKHTRGADFTGYKRSSLERRFRRRMDTVGCATFGDYLDFLEVNPEEFEHLFETLLINVTEFFRDPPAWDHLRDAVLPDLLAGKALDEPVRVWSAGCASGQEAYTCAMVLAELMGVDAYRERVKIYATDIDEDALSQARLATYTAKEIEHVPGPLREKYFQRADQRSAFRKDLRRTVIFGRNNLVQDAPISRLDLLICRNTLMYFTAETQASILRHFHFALLDTGALMLGKSEMMVSHREWFVPHDLKQRIFVKLPRATAGARAAAFAPADGRSTTDDERASRGVALDVAPQAHLIVSRTGRLTFANVAARALFSISRENLDQPFAELAVAHKPVELTASVEQALRERRRVAAGEGVFTPEGGDARRLDVTVTPLLSPGNVAVGVSVTFEDVSRYAALQTELESHRRDLELAYEELQSTNEELETINDELRERTGELNQVNDFLEAILTSLGLGVAVLDAQQRVQVWNRRAEDLWGLRSDEALDNHFLSLDIGLPSEEFASALRLILNGSSARETREIDAVNRRGRPIVCLATALPLLNPSGTDGQAPRGAIVMMEDRPRDGDGDLDGDSPNGSS